MRWRTYVQARRRGASAIPEARLTPGALPGDTDFPPNAPDESGGSSLN
jgi:hypothetical protein